MCVYVLSGMIGKLIVVGYIVCDIDMWVNVIVCLICVVGGCLGDMLYNVFGYGLFIGGFGIYYGVEWFGCMVVLMFGG